MRISTTRWRPPVLAAVLAAAMLTAVDTPAGAEQAIGFPTFTGQPPPAEPVAYGNRMMRAMYDAEAGGTDFWMDRLLARRGNDPAGSWLMTRGRTVYMRQHDNAVIGFGGRVAYYNEFFGSFSNQNAYTVTIGGGGFTENVADRLQTPSYWSGSYTNSDLRAGVKKFVTHDNVAVTVMALTNTGAASRTLALTVDSPFTRTATGAELTGLQEVRNSRGERLTTIFPRLSAQGLSPSGGKLAGEVTVPSGQTVTVKVQLGFVADEIPASRTEYDQYRGLSPANAFATHVRTYNRWWADNIPYVDVPEPAIKKHVYYRWWLMRFNFLDADIPGNDFQFPTSIEGVLGYNNAIALTVPMFIDDLKYLRDPMYSYGPWVSTGESSGGGRFVDNPGDPENWSNSYTQYIAEAAWRSYEVHGGQAPIVANLARYAEGDVKGQLDFYDHDGNGLIEYDWGALTGNDADAVSFHWRDGNLDRAEAAYQYSGALAAAAAYEQLGNAAKAAELRGIADRVRTAILDVLWNPDDRLFEHRHVATDTHVPWKEINNYYPFSVGAVPDEEPYTDALRLFADPAEYPIFPFYTANQADKAEAAEQGNPGSNNFSQINSTVQFRLFSSVLHNYTTPHLTATDYKKLLYWNSWAAFIGGDTAWPDSNEYWYDWNPATRTIGGRSFIHHTILGSSNWTVIEDVLGLRPRTDAKVELAPIDIGWDHAMVDNLRYRDRDLTVVWDDPADGVAHYPGVPEGYSVFLDGARAFTVDRLTKAVWDPATGQVDTTGNVLYSTGIEGVHAPADVVLTGERVVDLFQKAGADLTSAAPDLAVGGPASASYTASGSSPAAAVDGTTVSAPIWSSRGSPHAEDTVEVDLGTPRQVDDMKLYFYRDRTTTGLAEPATYRVQYHNGTAWVDVPGQARTPAIPRANYNHVRFPALTAQRLRVLMTHQSGHRTGLKELQVFRTGVVPPPVGNAAPYALATVDSSFRQAGQARLTGVVKDDALPRGALTSAWSKVSGPGSVVFADPNTPSTLATFTEPGDYQLRLTASDGERSSVSTVDVTATAIPAVANVATAATVTASYTSPWELAAAVNDGVDPPSSNDGVNRRWGTWPEQGEHWVQLEWPNPVRVNASDLYFFDDGGGVRLPASWKLQYWDGTSFVDIPGTYDVAANRYVHDDFPGVTTTRLRAVLRGETASVGVLEWQVHNEPSTVEVPRLETRQGIPPTMPATVTRVYADGTHVDSPVIWAPVSIAQVSRPGRITVPGYTTDIPRTVLATVEVRRGGQGG
ncbi:discoidin domain-containing protein [Actinophytocola oryzae]|uniref:Ig-like protein group 4 n=1 Tax=Actinophytocola oryzae TaxID=502181 RepID=A0A4R7UT12_9PSEU|nr:discoidin domain-containing protein [Actinophytocola oryzae]TDV38705.1 Ig-like protein group 4 [Actinophytocola oryzae]